MNHKKIITLITGILILSGFQLSAQMIPESYFQPKAGGSPKSDFYALFSYNVGFMTEADEASFNGASNEGINAKFFFPSNRKKGNVIDVSYNQAIQNVTLTGFQEIGVIDAYKPILSKNFEIKAKSISYKQWGFGLVYQYRQYTAGYSSNTIEDEVYTFNGIGLEASVGGYPKLDYKKGNWPMSFKAGLLLQVESFDQDEPGFLGYGELALERIRKKQGMSLYASIYARAQYVSYTFVPEWAQVDDYGDSYTYIEFYGMSIIPGFRIGFMF